MIKSNLSPPPTFPATVWDFVPFLCAGALALFFTALLVLLVEDDPNEPKLPAEHPRFSSSYQSRMVGLSEKEPEWATRPYSSYYPYAPVAVPRKSSPIMATLAAQTAYYQRPVFPKRLLALPPSPTSPTPTQVPASTPMLSMAKLIMHRHDQANRRARHTRTQRQQHKAQHHSQSHSRPLTPPPRTPLRV